MVVVAFTVMVVALVIARAKLAPRFRARNSFERILSGLMIFCSLVAILTTLGIVVSLVFEASRFFAMVPFNEFLFGLRWEPQIPLREDQIAGAGAFGAIPVFIGTLLIAAIAMLVATPVGLFTAIYLVEFASDRVRKTLKPIPRDPSRRADGGLRVFCRTDRGAGDAPVRAPPSALPSRRTAPLRRERSWAS